MTPQAVPARIHTEVVSSLRRQLLFDATMTQAVLVWLEDDRLRFAELTAKSAATQIGRSPKSTVVLNHKTVSRNHATVTIRDGVFLIENFSSTNPTKLNDFVIDRAVPLSDGDIALLGEVRLAFYDLAKGSRTSGPMRSHCSRENMLGDKKCWHCGTLLASAGTLLIERRSAVCHVLSAAGARVDLRAGELVVMYEGRAAEALSADEHPEGHSAAIVLRDGKPTLSLAPDTSIKVNGEPDQDGKILRTGDELRAWDQRLLIIVP